MAYPLRSLMASAASVLGLAAAVALASPGLAWAADDSIVVARDMDINSLDPARAYCDTCQIYLSAVYDTLLTLGPDNKTLVRDIAESWEVSPDATTFTFHLNPNAKFSDGSPVKGDDVKWSLDRLKSIKGGAAYLMDTLKSVEVKDPETVVITTTVPNSEFLGILAATYCGIINSKLASAHGANAKDDASTSDTADSWFLANSAGSGAFTLESYKADDTIRLKRNDGYWQTKANVSGVVLKQTADAVTQAQMLQSGAADIAMQVDPDTAKSIHDENVVFKTVPSFNFIYAAMSPIAKGAEMLNKLEVRQAIALAIDYQGAIDFAVGGQGKLQPAPLANGYPGSAGLPAPTTDVAKAKDLLAKAGYPNGFALDTEFPAQNVYGVDLSLLAQKLQQDLAKVNVKLNLKPVTYNVWSADVVAPGIPFTMTYWAPDYYGSAQYIQYFAMIETSPWGKQAGVGKTAGLDGKDQAALLDKALAAKPADVDTAYKASATKMIDDKIVLPVVSPDLVLAYRSGIGGVRYSACCNLPLVEVTKR